mgnify:CR=1 FL=1
MNALNGYYNGETGAFETSLITKWASIPVVEGDKIYWSNMTNNYPSGWSNGVFVQLAASRPASPITVPAGVDEVRVYATNSTDASICTKNKSDVTNEPYSDGKPSPRPDWPQEIKSVDNLSLVCNGKNMCPTADGTTIASDWVREGVNYIKYIGLTANNVTLTLSCNMTGVPTITGANERLYVGIRSVDGSSVISTFCNLTTAGQKSTTITGSGIVIVSINHNAIDSHGVDILLKDIQLELGSTATEYKPYVGHIIPLYDGILRSLPNGTKDELHLAYLKPSKREG